jgi:hypothetical protein
VALNMSYERDVREHSVLLRTVANCTSCAGHVRQCVSWRVPSVRSSVHGCGDDLIVGDRANWGIATKWWWWWIAGLAYLSFGPAISG